MLATEDTKVNTGLHCRCPGTNPYFSKAVIQSDSLNLAVISFAFETNTNFVLRRGQGKTGLVIGRP